MSKCHQPTGFAISRKADKQVLNTIKYFKKKKLKIRYHTKYTLILNDQFVYSPKKLEWWNIVNPKIRYKTKGYRPFYRKVFSSDSFDKRQINEENLEKIFSK